MTTVAETKLPLATVHGLYHLAITDNLAATRKFWTDIIGLREFPRPDFGYPGTSLWQLFVDDPSGVHLELTFECGGGGEEKPDRGDPANLTRKLVPRTIRPCVAAIAIQGG
jgi:catechol 2,3-dioxygenase-like lactoylglutathione lyase family enzyme